jgi:hypothetical protein
MKTSNSISGCHWSSKTARRLLLMTLLATSLNLFASEAGAPDMELLEFIADSVPAGDELVDPMAWQAMQETPLGAASQAAANTSDKTSQAIQSRQQTDKGKTGQ